MSIKSNVYTFVMRSNLGLRLKMAYNIAKMLLWSLLFREMTKEKEEVPKKDIISFEYILNDLSHYQQIP